MNQNKKTIGKKARNDGYKAENIAVLFLRLKGYKILERNFKPPRGSGAGEIDIITLKHKKTILCDLLDFMYQQSYNIMQCLSRGKSNDYRGIKR